MASSFNSIVAGGNPNTIPYTVATLPGATVVGQGFTAFVSDAITPTLLATVIGGGAIMARVFSDGTNWKVG